MPIPIALWKAISALRAMAVKGPVTANRVEQICPSGCINLHLPLAPDTVPPKPNSWAGLQHVRRLHQKPYRKLAGEAGVLASYSGMQLGPHFGGKRPGRFRAAIAVTGRSFS